MRFCFEDDINFLGYCCALCVSYVFNMFSEMFLTPQTH